jgi:ATP-dependent RNA helicase DDX24/MAK5
MLLVWRKLYVLCNHSYEIYSSKYHRSQGSGKTLAYGLPILHYLLSQPRPSASRKRALRALILCPTRELALQVSSHLNAILTSIEFSKNSATAKSEAEDPSQPSTSGSASVAPAKKLPPHVSIAAIVGGMSAQKQRRVIDRGVDVLVATPGRLWDILEDVGFYFQNISLHHLMV